MKKTNPFYEENAIPVSEFRDWSAMTLEPYNKNTASPYTKTRVILMNGTEFEQCWFLHNFSRHEKITTCAASLRFCAGTNNNNRK